MSIFKADDIFSDGMIIQRDAENFITGDGEGEITLTLERDDKLCGRSRIAADGRWRIAVPAGKADCQSYTINLRCGSQTIVINDVLFGDLFHITGQSNMELPLNRTFDPFAGAVPMPTEELIREYRVPQKLCFEAGKESYKFEGGSWVRACDDKNLNMSAAGYYFAKKLFAEIGVPVGLVNSSIGGSPIEGRLPAEVIREFPELDPITDELTSEGYQQRTEEESAKNEREWAALVRKNDNIGSDIIKGKYPSVSNVCTVPMRVNDLPDMKGFCGRIWFWRSFDIPEGADLSDPMLILGTLTDGDETYINGVKVGETGYLYPPRYYPIPEGLLKTGENRLALLLDINGGNGGFTEGKRYCVKLGDKTVELCGEWSYAAAVRTEPRKPVIFLPGLELGEFAHMTAPAYRLAFKGMLVYQGESNAGYAHLYDGLFGRFVEYYRMRCGYEIPVISVQLPNWTPGGEGWVMIRQKQLECCSIPNTTMAVTLGMGENNDLHPINKSAVGDALADCALRLIYGRGDSRPVSPVGVRRTTDGIQLSFPEEVRLTLPDTTYFEVHTETGWQSVPAAERDGGIHLACDTDAADKVRYAWLPDADSPSAVGVSGRLVPTFEINIR